MKMSNHIEPSSISAEAKSSLVDGEVLGQDADGGLIQWNATAGAPYNSGQSVEEFGVSNLSEAEMKRLNLLKSMESKERYVVVRLCVANQIQYLGRVSSLKEFEEYSECCGFEKSDIAVQDWKPAD